MESKLYSLDTKMDALRSEMSEFPGPVLREFQEKLDISWIFHEHALEGVVMSYSELKAAIDSRIISDVSLIPMYEDAKNHKIAVDFVRSASQQTKRPAPDLEFIKKLYAIVTPDPAEKGAPYRKENPLHRLYYHDIAPPDKIQARMKTLSDWLESDAFNDLHPVMRATQAQQQLLQVYPWTKNTGRVARLLTNYILISSDYIPLVIHSIERQRYYDSLRHDDESLITLVVESLEGSIETSSRLFTEIRGLQGRQRAS